VILMIAAERPATWPHSVVSLALLLLLLLLVSICKQLPLAKPQPADQDQHHPPAPALLPALSAVAAAAAAAANTAAAVTPDKQHAPSAAASPLPQTQIPHTCACHHLHVIQASLSITGLLVLSTGQHWIVLMLKVVMVGASPKLRVVSAST
jgi:hypothetical protein